MTNRLKRGILPAIMVICLTGSALAQNDYSSYSDMTDRLRELASSHSDYAQLESLTQTIGGHEVWMLTLGSGDITAQPAIAVIGGARGSHLLGSELALRFAEKLLNETPADSLESLLGTTTFYIVPQLNPDAAQQYFSDPAYARDGNARTTDDDRDGAVNEDGYEDLNGDGLITMMRVADRTGKWKPYTEDPRVMVQADIKKGERGGYLLFSEGRDNDNDGEFNEDGEGGVNLNKNFTFDYPDFQPGAGEHMLSENENRALLDFLFEEAWNTYAVISFGPPNNLSSPISFNQNGISQRVITGWYREDTEINKVVSDLYNETTGLSGAPDSPGQPGDIFQWAYFHYGRYSFSTPGWWTPETSSENGGEEQPDSNAEADYLRWADSQNLEAFVSWEEIEHPDFPGKTVEVGGIKPFRMMNPPYSAVDSLADKHTHFIKSLAALQADVQLVNFTVERAGQNLTRITVDVYNNGILPTASRLGERIRWVKDVKVEIGLSDGLSLVSGERMDMIDSLQGDESVRMSWLVRGSGTFTLEAGAPTAGFSTIEQTINN